MSSVKKVFNDTYFINKVLNIILFKFFKTSDLKKEQKNK